MCVVREVLTSFWQLVYHSVEGTRVCVVREVLTSFWQLVYHPVEGTRVRVVREVLTSFWQLVHHSLTVRTQEKVPCIWHELQKTQWEAIACIIVYSVKRYNYFPIFLLCAVIASVLFGEENVSNSFWNHFHYMDYSFTW